MVVATALVAVACLAAGRLLAGWLALGAGLAALWWTHVLAGPVTALALALAWGLPFLLLGVAPVRRALVAPLVLRLMGRALPTMSDTEREALEAGTVWFDGQIFSGAPHWRNLLSFRPRELSERERAFLDGPLAELCRDLDDWQVQQRGDLDEATWQRLKRDGCFGLIIPQEHGGLGFSARAHSEVVARLSTRSVTAAVTVMVPNSLGPAELLLHYGTEEQKRHWLPRLARGEEIPCFALTGPENGSDAAAMGAEGVVFRRSVDGREQLALRLSWDKRYTTLGPRATVIGLAFRLRDPERLLGGDPEPGITVVLVPAGTPGVEVGARHDPLGVPFLNGPTRGRDVVVPVEAILGGPARAGQGWRMLMDCLAAGRGISLPSLSAGCCQLALRYTAAYAGVRQQFGLPIGRFEGVEERLARMAGLTYLVDAARALTVGAVDAGEKPSVLSAVCKAWCTEAMRVCVTDAMDVLGGAGISRGPRNLLARAWSAVPIGITVEGANILTRSLIVFGQGAVRCHPWVQAELAAAAARDASAFDAAFFGHVAFTLRNAARAPLLALVDGG
ncbi:MAG: acyl-CoA dehydrogenase, partial [Planctomycetes bacterium]|nr:acyl-CoA dehydrogenase [Planctomycetota bacterium]